MEGEFTSVRWDRESTINTKGSNTPPRSPMKSNVKSPEAKKTSKSQETGASNMGAYSTSDDDNSVFIHSKVSSPQKESDGQNAYISYLIETHTNNAVFKSTRLKVRRRFSDFYFLYQCLMNDYPACAIPPLPDKQRLEYLKGDRFGHDFTSKRASSLNRFLERTSLHPVLKRAKIYHIFLETNDWNSYKESLNVNYVNTMAENNETLGPSNSVSESISDLFMNAFKHPQLQPNKEFVEINERCNKLNDNVVKIDKSFQKYVKRLGDLSSNFIAFSELVVKLDDLESPEKLSNTSTVINSQPKALLSEAKSIDSKASSFVQFSKGLENLAFGLNHLKRYIDNNYLISLKDLENYIYSIKNLIKVKEQKQLDFEVLSEYLSRAIHEKNQLLQQTGGQFDQESSIGVPHSTTRVANNPSIVLPAPKPSTLTSLATSTSNFLTSKLDDIKGINSTYQKKERLIKLSVKIETLEKEVVNAKKVFELFENEILHEVQYFDVIKSNELKNNLSGLTNNYISFYKNLISDWETIETSLENDINEHNKKSNV